LQKVRNRQRAQALATLILATKSSEKELIRHGNSNSLTDSGTAISRDHRHKNLVASLQTLDLGKLTAQSDPDKVIRLLCKHRHPIGLIFLAFGRSFDANLFAKYWHVRDKAMLDMTLGRELAFDFRGNLQASWVVRIQEGTMLQLIKGDWAFENFKMWERLIAPALLMRDSDQYAHLCNKIQEGGQGEYRGKRRSM